MELYTAVPISWTALPTGWQLHNAYTE